MGNVKVRKYLIDTYKLYLFDPRGFRARPLWSIGKLISTTLFVISITTPIRQIGIFVKDSIRRTTQDAR